MKKIFLLFFSLLVFALTVLPSYAGTVIGFSRFENLTNAKEFDYLSKILPDSFAVSIESNFDISSEKTDTMQKRLSENGFEVKSSYEDSELAAMSRKLSVDYYVYGGFKILPYNSIEIKVNIFNTATGEIFSFSNTGLMETEIFNLVDRLTYIFDDFFKQDFRYQSDSIPQKSKLAFITNLNGQELNDFYLSFMKSGYTVSSVQGNDLISPFNDNAFDKFRYAALKDRKFEKIRTEAPLQFHLSSWNSKKYFTAQSNFKKVLVDYYYRYPENQEKVLKNISEKFRYNIDFLFIVGFDRDRKGAWIRVFDLRNFDSSLIWLQTGIIPSDADSSAAGIAKTIMSMFPNEGQK